MNSGSIVSSDGARIAYDVTGKGPALMLLHGAGKTRRDWHSLGYVDRLKDDFTVITVDIRGMGESGFLTEKADYEIGRICDDISAVADACSAERFSIWGYSFGGGIARYAASCLDCVTALALVGVPLGPSVDLELQGFIDGFLKKWGPVAAAYKEDTLSEEERASAARGSIPVWVAFFQAMRDWPDIGPRDIRCPTILAVGSKDPGPLDWVMKNRTTLDETGICVQIIEGLSHQQEFEEMEKVLSIILPFLKGKAGEK